ncbi:MAG: MerR family transcriptional regulator [Kofleriaceae bacterium]|nr:MerR family transcriptional regulator [Kofleriaceae bacterium]MCB9574965.1 MerR family transcriptional regulator [Kofleriaceae bacterium]
MKISDLARQSGVPAPTIKHYMREGLLPGPHRRTSRNMAYYDARLAERVRVIKELQQERFLPLRVIVDLLEPAPSAQIRADLDELQRRQLGALAPAVRAGGLKARRQRGDAARRRSRTDVLASLQISAEDLALLDRLGLAQPAATRGGDPIYTGHDLDLLEVIDETRSRGMGDLFPMEILAPYVEAVRTLVRFEIDMFRGRVLAGARLPAMSLDEVAREATALGERMVVAMRAKLAVAEISAATPKKADKAEA